jgi:hypothetical protein
MQDRRFEMLIISEIGGVFGSPSQCELRVMCGPKYNAFSPGAERREEPGKFFLRDAWKLLRRAMEEETERWDGLE